jgi:pSer/pThr/pTyr-binding forkhead associated (FHA) protein
VQAGLAPPGRYLALAGGEETLVVALEDEVTRIGRGLGANLRLDEARVSRRHAIVLWRNGRVRLLDDRSSNGTFVNGRQVTEVELHDGDVIRVGPVELRYLELSAKPTHPRQGTTGAGPRASESRSQRAFEGWVAGRMRTRARERRTGTASDTRRQPSRTAA